MLSLDQRIAAHENFPEDASNAASKESILQFGEWFIVWSTKLPAYGGLVQKAHVSEIYISQIAL